MKDPHYQGLMNLALRALARRAHTTQEIQKKFEKSPHYDVIQAQEVMARLRELNFLNDEAYLQSAVEDGARYRLQGPLKIASRLSHKGISLKQTQEAWRALELPEKELARAALEKAQKRFMGLDSKKVFQRKAQFLAARGFSPEIVFELAKGGEYQ